MQHTNMCKAINMLLGALSLVLCSFTLARACNGNQRQVIVTIIPDEYPNETSWSLHDGITGALVDTGQANSDTICVDSSTCLRFTIFDAAGDGICCLYGHGSYTVTLNGEVIVTGGSFGFSETTQFNCPAGYDCLNPRIAQLDTMTAPIPETWYLFIPDSTGLYNISTCNLGNACSPSIYIYDHCAHLLIDTTNEGTTFYNKNGCNGNQAFISAAMPAGKPYYIRIGQQEQSCADDSIRWQIHFVGPIRGCTDSNSCNYNPLATISDSSCLYLPNPLCPMPDLTIDQGIFLSSLYLDYVNAQNSDCYVPDGCLNAYGERLLIRFTTQITNIGNQDYYLGMPDSSNPQFVYDPCHQHWHYIGYAEYLLYNDSGQQVQVGFKDGFCVEDAACDSLSASKYGCSNMGLTSGCSDGYAAYLDCQWLDITDVDTGNYTMLVGVNWMHRADALGHYERTYTNNWAYACIHIYYDGTQKRYDTIPGCHVYTDCAGDTFGSAQVDCNGVCNGTTVMGDLNNNGLHDSTDLMLYLEGMTNDTLLPMRCNDLNSDGRITVHDAARLNACLRYQAGTITSFTNAQTGQHLCEFPYRLSDFLDSVIFSISAVNWQNHYVDISVVNPDCMVIGYEFKLSGITVDSVVNLVAGYTPSIYWSPQGHITELSAENLGIVKNYSALSFIRVYFSAVQDSNICIASIVDVVNENYEQVNGIKGISCWNQLAAGIESQQLPHIKIVPNPSHGIFNLYLAGNVQPVKEYKIYDDMGRLVTENSFNGNASPIQIDLSGQSGGVYSVQINVDGINLTRRLVLVK